MPRRARRAPGGVIYHVLNRGVGRQTLFDGDRDFAAFVRALAETMTLVPGVRVLGYCVMGNHWHLVLWPRRDGELARFMQRLTITHVRRWVEHRGRVGWGSVYQGRYKSFPVQGDGHLLTLLRYVERNPLRARLVRRAEAWRWSSLGQQSHAPQRQRQPQPPEAGEDGEDGVPRIPIAAWPVPRRRDWTDWVNGPQTAAEEAALRRALTHDRPFGSAAWTAKVEKALGLGPLRGRGRPKGTGKAKAK